MLAAAGLAKLETGRSVGLLAAIIAAGLLFVAGASLWWVIQYDPWAYLNALSGIAGQSPTAIVPVAEALKLPVTRLIALAACVLLVLLLARRGLVGPTVAALLLVLLESVDLLGIRWRSLVTTPWRTIESDPTAGVDVQELRERGQSVFHYSDVVDEAPDRESFRQAQWPMSTGDWISEYRVLWAALFGNVSMVYRVGNLGGADGLQRRDMKVLLEVLPGLSLDDAARLLGPFGCSVHDRPFGAPEPPARARASRARRSTFRLSRAKRRAVRTSRDELARGELGGGSLEAPGAPGLRLRERSGRRGKAAGMEGVTSRFGSRRHDGGCQTRRRAHRAACGRRVG